MGMSMTYTIVLALWVNWSWWIDRVSSISGNSINTCSSFLSLPHNLAATANIGTFANKMMMIPMENENRWEII
jgi:hypothetical protein